MGTSRCSARLARCGAAAREGGWTVPHEDNNETTPEPSSSSSDRTLIEECLAGKEAAWEQLNGRLLERMEATAFKALGRDVANKALMEELAVDLVSTFFLNRRLLEAIHTTVRTLDSFFDFLIYRAAKNYYRKRAWHQRREVQLSNAHLAVDMPCLPAGFLPELYEVLTPAERKYLQWLETPDQGGEQPCPYGPTYARQLKHRVMCKVLRLLHGR
jgi:hypothetical protein